jgi:c-di-AMP phosphodiesterase-like protein
MVEQNKLYKNPSIEGYLKYNLVFIGILTIILIFTVFIPIFNVALLVVVLIPLSYFFIQHAYGHSYWYDINRYYIENVKLEYNYTNGQEYLGVIIANKNLQFYKYYTIYNGNTLLLIEYLRHRNKPLKIIKNAERSDLEKMVYDKQCRELYIIGHGGHWYLRINKKDKIIYSDFKGADSKDRVEQLHCDHIYLLPFIHFKKEHRPSLAEVLNAKQEFRIGRMSTCSDVINFTIDKLVNS